MFCHHCGKELKTGSRFCPHCGTGAYDPTQPAKERPPVPKENVPLGILGACLGGTIGLFLLFLCDNLRIPPAFVGAIQSALIIVGYDLFGKQRGTAGTAVVFLLIVIFPYLSHTLSWILLAVPPSTLQHHLFQPLLTFYALMIEGHIDISLYLQELLALYGFVILGAVAAFAWSNRRAKRFQNA